MVGVLGLAAWLLSRLLGPRIKRRDLDQRPAGPVPEREMPMADTPVILDTGGHDDP
jgi:hypothetical protein